MINYNLTFDNEDGTFPKKIECGSLKNTSGDMPMLSDLQLVFMKSRNSTQLLNINTTKFQVEREPVYRILYYLIVVFIFFV